MHLANYQCCICRKRADQVHHLNGRSSDTFLANLVPLCLPHHADASEKNPMRRAFKPGALRLTRDDHYARIAKWRGSILPKASSGIRGAAPLSNVQTVITAMALLEIERVEHDFLYGRHAEREGVLGRLRPFSKYNDDHIGLAILEFVQSAAHHTRSGLSDDDCASLVHLAIHFYPRGTGKGSKGLQERLAVIAISAASAMVYDAAVHLKRLRPALHGLTLLKFIHQQTGRYRSNSMAVHVRESMSSLLSQISRPDNEHPELFVALLNEFQKNMDDGDLSFPMFSKEIMVALHQERLSSAK